MAYCENVPDVYEGEYTAMQQVRSDIMPKHMLLTNYKYSA